MSDLKYMYIDFNSYFASVEQQIHPKLRGKPVAVVPSDTDSTCAIAASYEAKAYGIKTGTKIYEARRMCPGLITVPAQFKHYTEYHHRILEEIDKHIPVESVLSIDECAAALMGREREEENARTIAFNIKAGLAKYVGEHIRCSIGIAPNRYLAKIGTELQKPNGLVVIHEQDLPHCLYPLKLNDLTGIGFGMTERLHRNGIGDIKQLWQLSPKHMRKIWGSVQGERFWHMLRGHPIPDAPENERRSISHSHILAPAMRPREKACIVAHRLLLKAASRLRSYDMVAKTLSLSVRVENGRRLAYEARFHRTCDNFSLQHALARLWDQVLRETSTQHRIKKVSLVLHHLTPSAEIHPELFETASTQRYEQRRISASKAMDALNQKYGRDTVTMGFLPGQVNSFSGSKIAFTRIPELDEFQQ